MLKQTKPNQWSCIATSFAMVLDIPVSEFFRILGHDGSQILDRNLPDPACRRGVHIQECIYVAMKCGKKVTPVELFPQTKTISGVVEPVFFGTPGQNWLRFKTLIYSTEGVITGMGPSVPHAIAYTKGILHDPDDGSTFPYSRTECEKRGFYTQCLWIVT